MPVFYPKSAIRARFYQGLLARPAGLETQPSDAGRASCNPAKATRYFCIFHADIFF